MKKRLLVFLTALMLLFGAAATFVACGGTTGGSQKGDYGVTVLSPAQDPVQDVTVLWKNGSKTAGSAKTGADGKATASLPLGTYSIALEGQGEGYSYASVSVSSSMRNVILTLSADKVTYSVTVTDKDGAPASGVTVTWTNGASASFTAQTNANGAAERELDYGDYSVTLSDLPNGHIYDGAKSVTGQNPSVSFALKEGSGYNYRVTVRSEGKLLFKNQSVSVYEGTTLVSTGNTNDEGVYTFVAKAGTYSITVNNLPQGYTAESAYLSETSFDTEVVLHSAIITEAPAQDTTYVMGDIFHNYTFTTPYELNGAVWSKSVEEILAEKDVLILNNWGVNCSWCVREMPAMQEVYEKYSDQIEFVAVNNFSGMPDSNSTITDFAKDYTFPMMRDANNFSAKFGITGWPTTIVIDRYGAIARIESGAITSADTWERLIQKYIGNDYVQDFVPGDKVSDPITGEISKPDIELPDDHYDKVAAAMNDTNLFPNGASIRWFGETQDDTVWPYLLGTDPDVSPLDEVMYASNTGKSTSWAAIYAEVTVEAGKVLHFDYYAQTEEDSDVLSIIWDNKIVKTISGDSKGWQTCYLYADLVSGSHTMAIVYVKDESRDTGKDNVYFRRFGFANVSDIVGSMNMLRGAAYGSPAAGEAHFPYYAEVELAADGYYHVVTSKLHNAQFAGNDESPLLLLNMMGVTSWSSVPLNILILGISEETGEYLYDCTLTVNGVTKDYRPVLTEYLHAANSSDVEDCIPVNQELHDILVAFMKRVSGTQSHENEWLEACYFYSHYGDGEPVGNPVMGLMERTAIPVETGRYTANLTRNMYPFPSLIYTFTPKTSAVYKIETYIPDSQAAQYAAQMWLYDDATIDSMPLAYSGDERVVRDGVNEQNVVSYRYLTAGHKYYIAFAYLMAQRGTYEFSIENVGQSKSVLIPASGDTYNMVLDENENVVGIELSGAVGYSKDSEGYYHAMNPDGTVGDYIYLDVKYACTTALGTIPIERLVDRYVDDPVQDPDTEGIEHLDYKYFDFRYRVVYIRNEAEDGEIFTYDPQVDYSKRDPLKYRDYTALVKTWISSAPTTGEYAGLVKVNQAIVDFLKLYIEMRVNAQYMDGATGQYDRADTVLDNEWLRFCWYMRTYDVDNA